MDQGLLWFLSGAVLMIAELFLPGFIAVFFGFGALITGVAIWFGLPTDGGMPFLLFSVASVLSLLLMRRRFQTWFRGDVVGSSGTTIDEDFVGREATVIEGFSDASPQRGTVEYRGSRWNARTHAHGLKLGDRVTIAAQDGLTLTVRKLESR